jgi:hypothetical protein
MLSRGCCSSLDAKNATMTTVPVLNMSSKEMCLVQRTTSGIGGDCGRANAGSSSPGTRSESMVDVAFDCCCVWFQEIGRVGSLLVSG